MPIATEITERYIYLKFFGTNVSWRYGQIKIGGYTERNLSIPKIFTFSERKIGLKGLWGTYTSERKIGLGNVYLGQFSSIRYLQTLGQGSSERYISLLLGGIPILTTINIIQPYRYYSERNIFIETSPISVRFCQTKITAVGEKFCSMLFDEITEIDNTNVILTFKYNSERYCEIPYIEYTQRFCQLKYLALNERFISLLPRLEAETTTKQTILPIKYIDERNIQSKFINPYSKRWVSLYIAVHSDRFVQIPLISKYREFGDKYCYGEFKTKTLVDNSLLRFARFGMSERFISIYYFTWFSDRFIGLKTLIPNNIPIQSPSNNPNNSINSIIEFTSTYIKSNVDDANYEKIKEIKLEQSPIMETIPAQNIDFKGFTDNLYLLIDITKFLMENGYLDYFNETILQSISQPTGSIIDIDIDLFIEYYNSLISLIKQKLKNLFSNYFDLIDLILLFDTNNFKFIAGHLLVRIKPNIIMYNNKNINNNNNINNLDNVYNVYSSDDINNIIVEINNMIKDKIGTGNIRIKFFTSKLGKDYFDMIGYRQVIKILPGQIIAEINNQKQIFNSISKKYKTIKERNIGLKYTIE